MTKLENVSINPQNSSHVNDNNCDDAIDDYCKSSKCIAKVKSIKCSHIRRMSLRLFHGKRLS